MQNDERDDAPEDVPDDAVEDGEADGVLPSRRAAAAGGQRGVPRWLRLVLALVLLYLFLVAVDVLGAGLSGPGEELTEGLLQGIENPLLGLFVGVLATVLAQSSSVTTATVVGLVGAGVLPLDAAVPVVMGANIGTTITNTLASLGSIRRPEEFRRAFAGATMHDVFNLLSVAILLPLELLTGVLSRLAVAASQLLGGVEGGEFESPAKAAVDVVAGRVEDFVHAIAPAGLFAAIVLVVLGLALIFAALYGITRNMRVVIAGPAERSLNAALQRTGLIGIVVGLVLTVAVQSSSIATSLLIPIIAAGVLRLENAYPLTLGANLGTTLTALIAALAVDRIEGLQIALVHLFFNMGGLLLFYPVPFMRRVPLRVARWWADKAVRRRLLVVAYVIMAFYVVPLAGILLLR